MSVRTGSCTERGSPFLLGNDQLRLPNILRLWTQSPRPPPIFHFSRSAIKRQTLIELPRRRMRTYAMTKKVTEWTKFHVCDFFLSPFATSFGLCLHANSVGLHRRRMHTYAMTIRLHSGQRVLLLIDFF
jgi:hypothetical protein